MKYHTVLFDIDNTLLLKEPSIPERVSEALLGRFSLDEVKRAYSASELWQGRQIMKENETGVRMPDEEYLDNVAGVYRDILGLSGEEFQAVVRSLSRDCKQTYALAPGALEVLEKLRERGVILGIVSNNHTEVRTALEDMGIAGFFEVIIISEEVGVSKPDPEIMELACERAGSAPESSLYVGDHPFDILCAHDAHMPVVWMPVNRYMESPDYIGTAEYKADSLYDVLKYITNEDQKG